MFGIDDVFRFENDFLRFAATTRLSEIGSNLGSNDGRGKREIGRSVSQFGAGILKRFGQPIEIQKLLTTTILASFQQRATIARARLTFDHQVDLNADDVPSVGYDRLIGDIDRPRGRRDRRRDDGKTASRMTRRRGQIRIIEMRLIQFEMIDQLRVFDTADDHFFALSRNANLPNRQWFFFSSTSVSLSLAAPKIS